MRVLENEALDSMIRGIEQANELISRADLNPKQVDMALTRALGRTLKTVRTQASSEISKKAEVNLRLIRSRMKDILRKGQPRMRKEGRISFISASIPAVLLKPKQTARGVQAGGRSFRGAFIAPLKKGLLPERVFKRVGRTRYPLKEMRVPISKISAGEWQKLEIDKNLSNRFMREFLGSLEFFGGLRTWK